MRFLLCHAVDTLTILHIDDHHLIVSRRCVRGYHCSSDDVKVEMFARSRSRPSSADVTKLSTVLRRTCYEFSEFTQLHDAGKMTACKSGFYKPMKSKF